jgi:NRAMP (natural resistance-associated macrophage protein)-like metal ion transporter
MYGEYRMCATEQVIFKKRCNIDYMKTVRNIVDDESVSEDSDNDNQPLLSKLGPGLITGAADDDPSGIATYSQAGAQFGFNLLWTMLLAYPLMVAIQVISAHIGRVTGRGLATNLQRFAPRPLVWMIIGLMLIANVINIAADVAAMGDAAVLVLPGKAHWYAIGFGLLSVLLQVLVPYQRYVNLLKWLTLVLLAYVATVFVVHIPWGAVLRRTVWPQPTWSRDYVTTIVAVFGTTISPYLFFWQASQEVEELQADDHAQPLRRAPDQVERQFRRIKFDTLVGMGVSNVVAFFIMLTTATTLHAHGVSDIQTSSQAASALKPIAGELAFVLFALGIVGTGLLAIPVLAGSAAYAMAGAFHWQSSLEKDFSAARKFYTIIIVATLAGVGLNFAPIDPIKALFWSSVINGVTAVPVMVVMMLVASSEKIMGNLAISPRLRILGWLCTAVMGTATLVMLATFLIR